VETYQPDSTGPVEREVTVKAALARTFEVYTSAMGTWWPRGYHIGGSDLADVVLEPRVGGRWYERGVDGTECDWGRVLAWEPPNRIAMSWQISEQWAFDPEHGSRVEIRFTALGPDTTKVELIHSEFEGHGGGAGTVRDAMSQGTSHVLDLFRAHLEAA
jgi:uncharacterized protein YndB with AHSA1/START domain